MVLFRKWSTIIDTINVVPNLWLLPHTYQVDISFQAEDMLQGIRENDQPLMAEFYHIGHQTKEMAALNFVMLPKFAPCLGYHHMRWETVDEFVLSDSIETSISYTFPHEDHTTSDFKLWDEAIRQLCSGTTRLPYTLG